MLEIGGGTGNWTVRIAQRPSVEKVTVVDSSIEMVTISLGKLGELSERVRFVVKDVFSWSPDKRYDSTVFCYFLSHVPDSLLGDFLGLVAESLEPGGRFFFVDARPAAEPTAPNGATFAGAPGEATREGVQVRRIGDRDYSVVQRYRPPGDLLAAFAGAGLQATVSETGSWFQFGFGHRTGPGGPSIGCNR